MGLSILWLRGLNGADIECQSKNYETPWVHTGMVVGVQPRPRMTRVGFGGVGSMQTARSLGTEMVKLKRRAKADMRWSSLYWRPVKEHERETRSSATVVEPMRTV